jgi:hypothetical protein
MKKSFPAPLRAFWFFAQTRRLKVYSLIALFSLVGCMATQNRWQATQMRQQVMDYYNDQIMENLIRTEKDLPFVHVDITNLTAQDLASLSGTFGGGETPSFTRTSRSSSSAIAAALPTIARGVTRPFSYSITPARNTTLSIQAAPVLGKLSADSEITPTPSPTATASATPPFEKSKETKVTASDGKSQTLEEFSPKKPTPKPLTVYDLYDRFICNHCKALVSNGSTPPKLNYVPGTIKRWGNGSKAEYYYIWDDPEGTNKKAYRDLCRSLFTKGQAQSIETTIENKAQAAALVAPR